jgi:hypothetical protein
MSAEKPQRRSDRCEQQPKDDEIFTETVHAADLKYHVSSNKRQVSQRLKLGAFLILVTCYLVLSANACSSFLIFGAIT